ncbi:uncharacterized protein LOC113856969 [Abrus precatorius]|uniref:Uncharacterized protein LOC113856969 n=1 Tax=Abrus precatorius TaxID=3816 RepID=A0A8B8KMF9_ABRPR|nr:uncharacterized protein LOC113856969 [Abrus precatorius]
MPRILLKERGAFGNADTGGAWLSSARAVRLPVISRRKVRMTSSHHAPYALGDHTCYNGRDKGSRSREGELTPKPVLSSDCRLQLAYMKPESLVIAGQPYGGEFVPGLVHTARHTMGVAMPEVVTLTARRGMPKAGLVTGVKS